MIAAADRGLATARAAAAQLLRERGYAEEAAIVARGAGDDFAEVRTALALLRILAARAEAWPEAKPMAGRFTRRLAGEEC